MPGQVGAMDPGIADVDVLADSPPNGEELFVQIVAMPHHHKVETRSEPFSSIASIGGSQALPLFDWKLARISRNPIATVLTAFLSDALDELSGSDVNRRA